MIVFCSRIAHTNGQKSLSLIEHHLMEYNLLSLLTYLCFKTNKADDAGSCIGLYFITRVSTATVLSWNRLKLKW